jgi:hypothetical protein
MRASRLKEGGFTGNGEYSSLEIASLEAAANAWLQVYGLGVYRRPENRVLDVRLFVQRTGRSSAQICPIPPGRTFALRPSRRRYVLTAIQRPRRKPSEPGMGMAGWGPPRRWSLVTEDAEKKEYAAVPGI